MLVLISCNTVIIGVVVLLNNIATKESKSISKCNYWYYFYITDKYVL